MKPEWVKYRMGLIVIVVATVLLEVLSYIEFNYARKQVERELVRTSYTDIMEASLRIQLEMKETETVIQQQVWLLEAHLNEPAYIRQILSHMVCEEDDNIVGVGVAYAPGFFPDYGRWCELYALWFPGDSVIVSQVGGANHDYTKKEFYLHAMQGDPVHWTSPYNDPVGEQGHVITCSVPLRNKSGEIVATAFADLKTQWMGESINVRRAHPAAFTMVMTESGELVADPPDSLASQALIDQLIRMCNDTTVEKDVVHTSKDKKHSVMSMAFYDPWKDADGHMYYRSRREAPHWIMAAVCYDKEAFGELRKMRLFSGLLRVVGLLILALIIRLLANNGRKFASTQMAQERIEGELKVAREIQHELLPKPTDASLKRPYTIACSLTPAREVGGDLYDYFVRDEKLFFCIGDVSGKGVPAAMLMAVVHTLFRSAASHESQPVRIIQTINETSCQNNESNMFVTMFIGVLDLPTGRLRYCNAGHDKPIWVKGREPKVEELSCEANIPIGLFDDFRFVGQETELENNAILFLYIDGLTEAMNPARKQFGLERVLKTIKGQNSPEALLEAMTGAVKTFVEGAEQSDDLTMLAIRYEMPENADEWHRSLVMDADLREVSRLSAFIKEVAAELKIEDSLAKNIRLAVEEAVVNCISYAQTETVEVDAYSNGEALRIVIRDSGAAFDPTEVREADTSLSAEERPVGGLGILLVRQLMDSINYERIDGKNVLTLIKQIR